VLAGLPSVTARRLLELAAIHGTAAACLAAVRRGEGCSPADRERAGAADPEAEARRVLSDEVGMIAVGEPGYPPSLIDLFDPPAVLFVRGAPIGDPMVGVAVVGARNASPSGRDMARALGRDLATAGATVISGGARGIDAHAHRGAIDAGGPTIAVLGCGLDIAYPREHRDLFESVVRAGSLVSEYPAGTRAEPFRFPARNRIVAALARAVVVVEGAEGSGSMITAEHALEVGREVFAVPGDPGSALARVPLQLIREGAGLIRGPDDLLSDLGLGAVRSDGSAGRGAPTAGLPEVQEALLEAVAGSVPTDVVAARTGRTVPEVLAGLMDLELRGLVRQVGGRYERRREEPR
jgi:DNA processing protein